MSKNGPQAIRRFRGLASWLSLAESRPDRAIDLMNVIPTSAGPLEKMRLPTLAATAPAGKTSGPDRLLCYPGYPTIFAQYGAELRSGAVNSDGTITLGGPMAPFPTVAAALSSVEMNGVFFFANGTNMFTGAGIPWGITAPAAPSIPKAGDGIGNNRTISGISRNGGTSVVTAATALPLWVKVGDKITIAGCSDASFNGTFVLASVDAAKVTFTWTQVGAGTGVIVSGTISAASYAIELTITSALRSSGSSFLTISVEAPPSLSGAWITVVGVTDTSFNGTFRVVFVNNYGSGFLEIQYDQPGLPDAGSSGGTVGTLLSISTGVSYKIAGQQGTTYFTSASGACPLVNQDGSYVTGTNRLVVLKMPAPPTGLSVGVDLWNRFRTLDGGGDFFHLGAGNIMDVAGSASPADSSQDPPAAPTDLNTQERAPLLNDPPPAGKYLVKFQGRIYVGGLSAAGQTLDVAYSGYEQILLGDPPRSFPPLNRIKLRFGAQPMRGFGVIEAGVVVFGLSGRMYMQRGIIEDIAVNTPVSFTSYLQELPWEIGTVSHASIVGFAQGLVWVATDKTVRLFDGASKPLDISGAAYPLLRSITAGQEQNIVATYYSWLDREWYVMTCCTDDSVTPNRIICFDLTPDANLNIGIFVSSIQADSVGVAEDPNGQRRLYIAQGGAIKVFDFGSAMTGGLFLHPTSTAGQLAAWWEGGFLGNEEPGVNKNWRYIELATQPDADQFRMDFKLVDDKERTFEVPEFRLAVKPFFNRFDISGKALRCAPRITFPVQDRSCSVLELRPSYVAVERV